MGVAAGVGASHGQCVRKEGESHSIPAGRRGHLPKLIIKFYASRGYKRRDGILLVMGTAFWTTEEASSKEMFKDIKMD